MKTRTQKFRLKIPSLTENLQLIRDFILKITAKGGFDSEVQEQIALAVDEACTNVIKHAHKNNARRLIDIQVQLDTQKIKIIITDKGEGFDITKLEKPDLKKFTKEARHGGLGIFLMRTLMDDVQYEFNPGVSNKVQMIKYRQNAESA